MSLQELKSNFIVDVAEKLFFERSIFNVTIKDIAKEAGIGEMTIYRYFSKKQNIVLAVAMRLEKEVYSFFDLSKGKTGFDKLSLFFNSYSTIFEISPHYFRFIRDFDSYMLEYREERELNNYEENLDLYKNIFLASYNLGLKDGSVKNIENPEMFYYASTHSILELCKKLSYEGLLSQDSSISKCDEIKTLVKVFLGYLSK